MSLTEIDNIPFGLRRENARLSSLKEGMRLKKAPYKSFSRTTTERSPSKGSIRMEGGKAGREPPPRERERMPSSYQKEKKSGQIGNRA